MSLWHIAWSYLWDRKFTSGLTVLSVALAVALISAVLTIRDEVQQRFEEEQQAYDMVVGPPGSPLQLVLNAVYFLDRPVGAIPYSYYEKIAAHEDVAHAFPVGLGDTYKGFRIVGTIRELFDYPWVNPVTDEERNPFRLAEGRFFEAPMEAVISFLVAKDTGLSVGDRFVGTHGTIELPKEVAVVDHSEDFYTVVGILEPSGTSSDRAIFVNLDSVWDMHAEEDIAIDFGGEKIITAVLVDLYSPVQQFTFKAHIMEEYKATAAIPIEEVRYFFNQVLGPAVVILKGVGYLIVVISAISILVGLYLSIIQRRRDLAIMRALGASAIDIFGVVIIEAFLVSIMGIGAGWALGKVVALGMGVYMSANYGFAITGVSTSMEELSFFGIVGLVGILAGVLPAWQAYRMDVAKGLTSS